MRDQLSPYLTQTYMQGIKRDSTLSAKTKIQGCELAKTKQKKLTCPSMTSSSFLAW